jgi:hypothetical protein
VLTNVSIERNTEICGSDPRRTHLESSAGNMKEKWIHDGDGPRYLTGRLVLNWAETYECRPERFYRPRSEDEVAQVRGSGSRS